MKEKKSEAKYQSRFSPDKLITAAQWLAEYIVDRQAKIKGQELGLKFWENSKIWEKELLKQIRSANSLLKLYSPKAILLALRTTQGKKIYSLNAKWLDDLVKEEERKIELVKINQEPVEYTKEQEEVVPLPTKRPEFKPKKDLKDRLD